MTIQSNSINKPARVASINRKTAETNLSISVNLDANLTSCHQNNCHTGIGFFDHMLHLLAYHSRFELSITASGDTHIDDHHTVEDTGIALGHVFKQALGDCAGITRYASLSLPMDEALCQLSLDISNRPFLHYDTPTLPAKVGQFDTELVPEFLRAFTQNAGLTLHVDVIRGHNSHHIIESVFKALGRALATAVSRTPHTQIPSSKGCL